jgi:hypothetical protein
MTAPEAALARMLAASRSNQGTLLLRGTVQSWDPASGYIVAVNGTDLPVTTVLSTAEIPEPGSVVALLRHKSTILVLGLIIPPADLGS